MNAFKAYEYQGWLLLTACLTLAAYDCQYQLVLLGSVSLEQGEATAYSFAGSEERGRLFIGPYEKVYPMVVGENAKERTSLNVVKGKKLTNVRHQVRIRILS